MPKTVNKVPKALTLIELLFVIIIIGILTAVSFPRFRKVFNNLQLNSFSADLQNFMNSMRQRAIVESSIVYLNIDGGNKVCQARFDDNENNLGSLKIPKEIMVQPEKIEVLFYPDGAIDKVTIKLMNFDNKSVVLTTKGVFGGVKAQVQQ